MRGQPTAEPPCGRHAAGQPRSVFAPVNSAALAPGGMDAILPSAVRLRQALDFWVARTGGKVQNAENGNNWDVTVSFTIASLI